MIGLQWRSFVCMAGYTVVVSAVLLLRDIEPGTIERLMAAAGALVLGWHCQECEESERAGKS